MVLTFEVKNLLRFCICFLVYDGVGGDFMTDKFKSIFIGIIFFIVLISGTSYIIDTILIDGLKVDKGFLGSVLGGAIGTFGVIGTTYFIIEANKEATKIAADLQDKKERERIIMQFEINQVDESSRLLIELNNYLFKYKLNAYRIIEYINLSTLTKLQYQSNGEQSYDNGLDLNELYSEQTTILNTNLDRNSEIILEINRIINTIYNLDIANQVDIEGLKKCFSDNSNKTYNRIMDRREEIRKGFTTKSIENRVKKILEITQEKDNVDKMNDQNLDNIMKKVDEVGNELRAIKINLMEEFKLGSAKC